ncbi:hypothetical protein BU15DRAFT_80486 [Melanogaster broomeanus]|nr:hypothetical protein BU15DRAFT_80486 [Melanogaster broomeanus]
MRYVPSADNPTDGPSHGIYPPLHLLPEIPLPPALAPFISNSDVPDITHHETIIQQPFLENSNGKEKRPPKGQRITYHGDLTPIPSPLQPSCRARERLCLQIPTTSCLAPNPLSTPTLIKHLDTERINLKDVIAHTKSIPEPERAPASSILISSFLSTLAGQYSDATISNYLRGVPAWHILHGVKWSLNDNEIEALLKAAIALTPPSSKHKPCKPYTIEISIAP